MSGFTPLERAIVRAIDKGLETRDKIKKEFKYFDPVDIDEAINRLIDNGVVISEMKGFIRKSEKLRLASPGSISRASTVSRRVKSSGRSITSASYGGRGFYSGSSRTYYRETTIIDDDDDNDIYDDNNKEEDEGLFDKLRDEAEEIRDRVEDAVEDIKDEVEDVIGDEGEEEDFDDEEED